MLATVFFRLILGIKDFKMKFVNDLLLGLLIGIPVLAVCDLCVQDVQAALVPGCTDDRECCDSAISKGDRCDTSDIGCLCKGEVTLECKKELNSQGVCIG